MWKKVTKSDKLLKRKWETGVKKTQSNKKTIKTTDKKVTNLSKNVTN